MKMYLRLDTLLLFTTISIMAMAADQTTLEPFSHLNVWDFVNQRKMAFELEIVNHQNSFYYVPISFGSNGEIFNMLIDTGSSDVWVLSSKCPLKACENHHKYEPSLSSTSREVKDQNGNSLYFSISYGSGKIQGSFYDDIVTLNNFTLEDQTFGSVYQLDGDTFNNAPFDGILGLGYPNLAASRCKPFFDNLAATSLLAENLFAVWLSRTPERKGSIMFGGINLYYINSRITYHNIRRKGYWELNLTSIYIGETEINVCDYFKEKGSDGCGIVVDTGTSVIAGPETIINTMMGLLNYNEDCNNVDHLPNMTFVIDDEKYVLDPRDYLVKIKEENAASKSICMPGLMPMDVPPPKGPVFILGALFLHKYYTIFDRENLRMGFSLAEPVEMSANREIISMMNVNEKPKPPTAPVPKKKNLRKNKSSD